MLSSNSTSDDKDRKFPLFPADNISPLAATQYFYSSVEAAGSIRMVFTRMIPLTASEQQCGEDDRGFCERWEAGLDEEKAVFGLNR